MKKETVVIGAGIIGLACAARLTLSGFRVRLIDPNSPGQGASFGNAGHIATEQIEPLASPDTLKKLWSYLRDPDKPLRIRRPYFFQALPWLLRFAWACRPERYASGVEQLKLLQSAAWIELERLFKLIGSPCLLHQNGNLLLIENAKNQPHAIQHVNFLNKHHVDAQWLCHRMVLKLTPMLNSHITGAIHFPKTGHVSDPYTVCQALHQFLLDKNVGMVRATAQAIRATSEGLYIDCRETRIKAHKVVICAGAWSAKLAASTGIYAPLETERGYHLNLNGYQSGLHLPVASYERKVIISPLHNATRITGGVEFGGLELPEDQSKYGILSKHLKCILPDCDHHTQTRWMGFRPSLPDHLPIIGQHPANPNILFAFGHQHLGLTLSGITATLIDYLHKGALTPINLYPFRPERFGTV